MNINTIFINKYDKKNITLDNFLSAYMLNTSKKYNNELLMNKKYKDIYNPTYSIYDIYRDLHYKCYDISFIEESYLEKGNNKKTIEFYYDSMFNLNVVNNKLDKEETKLIKKQMKTDYSLYEEDPSEKAYYNSIQLISDDLPVKLNARGYKKDLRNIDIKDSYNYYKNEIKNSKVIIFVTGNINNDLLNIIDNNIKNNIYKNNYDIKDNYEVSNVKKVKEKIDKTKFNQSILYEIYKIPNITKKEREVVLPLFNIILGGPSSRLFNNIREKNSLAYYAYSNFIKSFGIIYMYAGINNKNYEKTKELMNETLNDIKKGNINKEEIDNSKEYILSSLYKNEDNIYSIVNDMITNVLFNKIDRETYKEEIKKIKKQDLITLANKLELDVVYLLRGI